MDLLKREIAPLLPEAWEQIDREAARTLKLNLAGRRLVDFDGPHGWRLAAVNTGELELPDWQPIDGVDVGIRRVQPLLELRTPIKLRTMDLDVLGRGDGNPDLSSVAEAAERVARTEDGAIFNGLARAGIVGLLEATPHPPQRVADVADYPRAILSAMATLARARINGPYAVALGPAAYDEVFAAVEAGYPVAKQIGRQVTDGPIVRAPVVEEGGVVISIRGGDYRLTVGQDLSIGYVGHDRNEVELYLTESFTFRVLEPAAAVRLTKG